MRCAPAGDETPLSATAITSSPSSGRTRSAVPRSTSNVVRSRLFTPMIEAPAARARRASSAVCASTKAAIPVSATSSSSPPSAASSRIATISSTMSAPAARACHTWAGVRMKSLRSTGSSTAARTAARSSSEPPKWSGSVSTEMAAAPPSAYEAATVWGSRPGAMAPADGDRRFTSAITPRPGALSASTASRGAGRSLASARNSASRSRTAGRRRRTDSTMGSSTPSS